MPGARAGWSLVSVTAFALSCTTTGTGARGAGSTPMAVTTVAPPSASAPPPPPSPARAAVIARLARLNQTSQFLFGEENATLWGMYLDGAVVSTNTWFENTARAGRFTSDSAAIVGDDPAVLGVSLGMLAFEPPEWNRRTAVAGAIKRQIAEGGMVTMDWHAASCTAHAPAGEELASVNVAGRDIPIHAVAGGTLFYAEEEYTRPIASRADVPESLKCLCQIANDRPLGAGADEGVPGKSWLTAQAKYAAQVMRDEGLAGLPIIVRPFHEHTGSWFWWGQPYWNCAALLGEPAAVSGPDAYKAVARTFITALRSEPGMDSLVFAYSPDRLLAKGEEEPFGATEKKVMDPVGRARDQLRERIVRELEAAGLAYVSPAERATTLTSAQVGASPARADAYVAQRRPRYTEAYAGDDVFDLLGIDLYHPVARTASAADLDRFRLQLRVVAEEARARGKPWALTEAGTYRLHLAQLAAATPPGQAFTVHGAATVEEALARLFDPADRAALLRHFGLEAPGPVTLDAAERTAVVPRPSEDWYNQQLLVMAREAHVAYALVWQTYHDAAARDRYVYYYVPFPGHPEADSFQRFYADPATCFLRDKCGAPK
jgi:hypothetical protein